MKAIQAVAEGSPAGITLLQQGPPGTGKTRTILGVLAVLLAGACPHPKPRFTRTAGAGAGTGASKVAVGASLTRLGRDRGGGGGEWGECGAGAGAKVLTPSEVRVLLVAPSNAAVDELVHRLCVDGVLGKDGKREFPSVVRLGSTTARGAEEWEGGEGVGWGGEGSRGDFRGKEKRTASKEVQGVALERLAEERKRRMGGTIQDNRVDILLHARIVCGTLSSAGAQPLVEAVMLSYQSQRQGPTGERVGRAGTFLNFDAVVMDEAAQAVEPSSLIPFKYNPRAIVMVGDPAQLSATLFSRETSDAKYGQSLFQRLTRGGYPKLMLDTQYRMHPKISSFASDRFYHGQLRSAESVTEESHGQPFHLHPRLAPYLFHNVATGRMKRGALGSGPGQPLSSSSLSNQQEADYVVGMIGELTCSFPGIDFRDRLGVIAPYRNQHLLLQRSIKQAGLHKIGVEVATVDGFQGREKDIIILSCVRAPEDPSSKSQEGRANGGIGFLDDWRRLNVAITRAKYAMWIVGHASTLKQNHEWRELIMDSKNRKAYVESVEEMGFGEKSQPLWADQRGRGVAGDRGKGHHVDCQSQPCQHPYANSNGKHKWKKGGDRNRRNHQSSSKGSGRDKAPMGYLHHKGGQRQNFPANGAQPPLQYPPLGGGSVTLAPIGSPPWGSSQQTDMPRFRVGEPQPQSCLARNAQEQVGHPHGMELYPSGKIGPPTACWQGGPVQQHERSGHTCNTPVQGGASDFQHRHGCLLPAQVPLHDHGLSLSTERPPATCGQPAHDFAAKTRWSQGRWGLPGSAGEYAAPQPGAPMPPLPHPPPPPPSYYQG
ncbi:unnamed protein product [Discosporangium mesarthrocarpum]